jgi:hypothetical protein
MDQKWPNQPCHVDEASDCNYSSGTFDWQISETQPTPEVFVSIVMQLNSSTFLDVAKHSQ